MSIIWHLIRKDLRRLRWPLAVFTLLLVGEILFYASLAGLWQAPQLPWLNRLTNGPELLLRVLFQPLITYLLVGWLIYEDSPVEKDAQWITRPISGGQLFAAKMIGAFLMFILWPLALNVLWWLACGCGGHEVVMSARELCMVYFQLISLALACAALTDGFPRFLLWSFVGVVVYGVIQIMFVFGDGISNGLVGSRFLVGGLVAALVALGVAAHQFATRRHRRSLALVSAGMVLVGLVSAFWPWDFFGGDSGLAPERPDAASVQVKLAPGPVQLQKLKARYHALLPLKIEGLPDNAMPGHLILKGDWSYAGRQVWTSQNGRSDSTQVTDAIRRVLGLKGPPQAPDLVLWLPFSLPLAQRAAHEPIAFHGGVRLPLMHLTLLAELPLRDAVAPAGARTCTISDLYYGPPKKGSGGFEVGKPNVVSLVLTERSANGLRANAVWGSGGVQCVLVNRRTGEIFTRYAAASGPVAGVQLNQVMVTSMQQVYRTGTIRLEDLTVAVLRIDGGEMVRRELDVNPVTFDQSAQ